VNDEDREFEERVSLLVSLAIVVVVVGVFSVVLILL
jgi:hypothetical protein